MGIEIVCTCAGDALCGRAGAGAGDVPSSSSCNDGRGDLLRVSSTPGDNRTAVVVATDARASSADSMPGYSASWVDTDATSLRLRLTARLIASSGAMLRIRSVDLRVVAVAVALSAAIRALLSRSAAAASLRPTTAILFHGFWPVDC